MCAVRHLCLCEPLFKRPLLLTPLLHDYPPTRSTMNYSPILALNRVSHVFPLLSRPCFLVLQFSFKFFHRCWILVSLCLRSVSVPCLVGVACKFSRNGLCRRRPSYRLLGPSARRANYSNRTPNARADRNRKRMWCCLLPEHVYGRTRCCGRSLYAACRQGRGRPHAGICVHLRVSARSLLRRGQRKEGERMLSTDKAKMVSRNPLY